MKVRGFKLLPGVLHLQATDHERLHRKVEPKINAQFQNPLDVEVPISNTNTADTATSENAGATSTSNAAEEDSSDFVVTEGTESSGVGQSDSKDDGANAPMNDDGWTPVSAPERIIPTRQPRVNEKAFKDKFVLSIDGERYDPGHGIVCEVHQGLANIISTRGGGKYLPSNLHKPPPPGPEEVDEVKDADKWYNDLKAGRLGVLQAEKLAAEELARRYREYDATRGDSQASNSSK